MGTRAADPVFPFTERVRELTRTELERGWKPTNIAAEMHALGFPQWSEHIVAAFARGQRQGLQLDEGLALMAVFGGHARWVSQYLERMTRQMQAAAERRGSPKREELSA